MSDACSRSSCALCLVMKGSRDWKDDDREFAVPSSRRKVPASYVDVEDVRRPSLRLKVPIDRPLSRVVEGSNYAWMKVCYKVVNVD